ncbi:hypothetical protein C8F04DRAFT_1265543 [Mycena alexandri]|uniref:Uncharacterized protein n=1 Tax=Mycena alexandri TaxID=1745969 RepID=A0AAD6WXY5_9AGAR|nr:hypothetical protein C8F04DRAFT_1265543 [Mycena alexandri]
MSPPTVDLQKGERHANLDDFLGCTFQAPVLVSFDCPCSCQSRKIQGPGRDMGPGNGELTQTSRSHRQTPQIDGEAVEAAPAALAPRSTSREMGPGSHVDVLESAEPRQAREKF